MDIAFGLQLDSDAAILLAAVLAQVANSEKHHVNELFAEQNLPPLGKEALEQLNDMFMHIAQVIREEIIRHDLKPSAN